MALDVMDTVAVRRDHLLAMQVVVDAARNVWTSSHTKHDGGIGVYTAEMHEMHDALAALDKLKEGR